MKTGRNDPCHCGSGKKYKKCCLEQDMIVPISSVTSDNKQYKPKINAWEPEDEYWDVEGGEKDWDEDSDNEVEEDSDEDSKHDDDDDFDDDENFEEHDDDFDDTAENDETELPEISEEETKLVDEWWDIYKKISQDTVKEREHLVAFMDKYPHLTDHLHLYHEVLFELGHKHYQKGIYEIFVDLLLRVRKEHPWTYKQSFSYYDSDLIYWCVAKGRIDEIDDFWGMFKEEDDIESEKICDLRTFFRAINRSDILIKALADSKKREYIIPDIGNNIVLRYVDKEISDETLQALTDEIALETVESEIPKKERLKRFLTNFQRPFSVWDANLPKKRSQAFEYFRNITDNFSAFLYKKTALSFNSAVHYSEQIYDYYRQIVSSDERPAETFMLDKKSILNYTVKPNSTMFWGYNMSCFFELNALYLFVAYLNFCGNITDEQQIEMQRNIAEIYKDVYEASKEEGPEMLSFEKFPLWEVKEN